MVSRMGSSRTQATLQPVVVGVADHNGWAILVTAAAASGVPTVVDRRRAPLIEEGVPSQPYHHETLALSDTEGEQLLRKVRRSISLCTALAFDRLSADLRPQYRITAITIRQPPLAHLPATVREVHGSYYTLCRADGMLYHEAICAAARQRNWNVHVHGRGEEIVAAADALRVSTGDVERFINDFRRTLQPPWTAEHRSAFAAAIASLSEQARLRLPTTEPAANGKAR